ncbi:hypothetical protein KJ780_00255 [Candidatus Micrarchaeota archaeon]|nr:hypothetical protein [Candidatus Micrarchaeota archaeon]
MDVPFGLKKEDLYKVLAIAFVVFFLLSGYTTGLLAGNKNPGVVSTGYENGTINVNATLIKYDPYIVTDASGPIEGISNFSDVDDIILSPDGYVVALKTTENITGIYSELKKMNISGVTNAAVNLDAGAQLQTSNGTTVELSAATVTVLLEPIFKENEKINMNIYVITKDGRILGNSKVAYLQPDVKQIEVNATISFIEQTTTYIIPWEQRMDYSEMLMEIKVEYGSGNVSIVRNDYVIGSIESGSNISYVVGIISDKVFVGNNTDRTQILNDIEGVSFPDSTLIIKGDSSDDERFESLESSTAYFYGLIVKDGEDEILASFTSSNKYELGDEIKINAEAAVIGDKIYTIEKVIEME